MIFETYIMKNRNINSEKTIKELIKTIESLDSSYISYNNKKNIIDTLKRSGNSNCTSRYGCEKSIVFSEDEIIRASKIKNAKDMYEYLIYRYHFKYIPLNHVKTEYPLVLAIEASCRCNLQCQMCFQKNIDFRKNFNGHDIMSIETFNKLLEELKVNKLYSVVFASRGEPLLNNNLPYFITKLKEFGVIDIKLNTNAVLLNEKVSRKILQTDLDLIVFSIDSVIPETYRNIRGANLNKVLVNINRFLEIKEKEFPNSNLRTRVSMVLSANSKYDQQKEITSAKEYWKNKVDELSIKSENDFTNLYSEEKIKTVKEPCNLLWERLYIWSDGSVNPCDVDYLSTLKLGNINNETIKDIWNGKNLQELRKKHSGNRKKYHIVCDNCVGY